MKTFSEAELGQYDGQDGRPAYIAHQGKVYDVSASRMWRGGRHMNRHGAGADLTSDIQAAPHDVDVLERCPQVGVLEEESTPARPMPVWIAWLLETSPFFRRHPHPMTVHFPIAFLMANPIFNCLYLITGNHAFETTAYHCLGGGALFTIVAMITGIFTWWYNYMARPMKAVTIKLCLSVITLVIALVTFVWRWGEPGVMANPQGIEHLYLILSLAFIPLIGVIGWYGAMLTFPLED